MTSKLNTDLIKNSIYKFTLLSVLALSVGACTGYGIVSVNITAILGAVIFRIDSNTNLMPIITFAMISIFALNKIGLPLSLISFAAGGLIALLCDTFTKAKSVVKSPAFMASASLATAITTTVLITTDYFGIGATGYTVIKMLKSYLSLGFHPNWRTILYGTIVMVIMITFPRKFKKGMKIVSASFIAVVFCYLLNFILIPKGTVSPIITLPTPEFKLDSFTSIGNINGINAISIIYAITIALATACCYLMAQSEKKISKNIYSIISPLLLGYAIPCEETHDKTELVYGIISGVLIAITMAVTKCFATLPLSCCAVLLIVTAWQQLDKENTKATFKKPLSIVVFIITVIISVIINIPVGLVIAFILSAIISKIKN